MNKLPLPDQRYLDAAEGWLGLGDHLAANEELEQISPQLRAHPFVLKVRYEIYSKAKKWDGAVEIAQTMVKLLPKNPWGPYHLAYSLHELKRTQEAYDTLKPVVDRFPKGFRKYYGLVADMVKSAWSRYVRRFNVELLGDRADLNEFLFGSERANLKEVGKIINEFQSGTCFYCRRSLKGDVTHVDHFVPWSRYPIDLGHNFVLAHAQCNGKKSDRLAASEHLDAWIQYQTKNAKSLASEFNRQGILNDFNSSVRIVNWAYSQTFENHGLTWHSADQLQNLPLNWHDSLAALNFSLS